MGATNNRDQELTLSNNIEEIQLKFSANKDNSELIFPSNTEDEKIKMHTKGNYWFYHKQSHPYDPPLLYTKLLSNAKNYIEIFDPYFNVNGNSNDQCIFDYIPSDTTLKILTLKGIDKQKSYLQDVLNTIKLKIPSSKNIRFGIRVINKADDKMQNFQFHDRFLIIDQKTTYLIGSSIGYHIESNQSTGIYMVNDDLSADFIKEIFVEYWKAAYECEIPIQYI